jgi:hypothetical protein
MSNTKITYYLALYEKTLIAFGDSFSNAIEQAKIKASLQDAEFDHIVFIGPVWLYNEGEDLPHDTNVRARKSEGFQLPDEADFAVDVSFFSVEILDTENRVYTYEVHALDESQAKEIAWDESNQNYHGAKQILSVT